MLKINSFLFCCLVLVSSTALAFQADGCGAGACRDCHTLNKKVATLLLQDKVSEVVDVKLSQVPGLWDVEVIYQGRKIPLYIDFSKEYLISGNIVKLDSGENLTQKSFVNMNKVDLSRILLMMRLLSVTRQHRGESSFLMTRNAAIAVKFIRKWKRLWHSMMTLPSISKCFPWLCILQLMTKPKP